MTDLPPLARIARLMGDPARALMLSALMDGRSRTAGELAREAAITPSTASTHLGKLVDGGLLAIDRQGRHRYHRLAGPAVAQALETILALSAPQRAVHRLGPDDARLRRARVCYDHLAGEIAVELAARWLQRGWIVDEGQAWTLSPAGLEGLRSLGVDAPDGRLRRPAVRSCLDWSERRPHLAGQLGASVLRAMRAADLVRQPRDSRVLRVTALGERELARWLR